MQWATQFKSLKDFSSQLCSETNDFTATAIRDSDNTDTNLPTNAIDEIDRYGITSFFNHLGSIWTSNSSSTASICTSDFIPIVKALLYLTKRKNDQNSTRMLLHTHIVKHFLLLLHRDVLPPDVNEFVYLHATVEICNVPFHSISNCIEIILFGTTPASTCTDLVWTSCNASNLMDLFFTILQQIVRDTTAAVVIDFSLRSRLSRVPDILDSFIAISSESEEDQKSNLSCPTSTFFDILFTYFFNPRIQWPNVVISNVLERYRTDWILSHRQEWTLTLKIVQECANYIDNTEITVRFERISSLLHHVLLLCRSLRAKACRVALVRLFWYMLQQASIISPPTGKASSHQQSSNNTEWSAVRVHVSMILYNVESVMKQQANHTLVIVLLHEIERTWARSNSTYWLETLCLFLICEQTSSSKRVFQSIADHAFKSSDNSTSFRAMILDLVAFVSFEKWDVVTSMFVNLGFSLMEQQVTRNILQNRKTSFLQWNGAIDSAPFGIRLILSCLHHQLNCRTRVLDNVFTNLIVYSGHVTEKQRSDTFSKKGISHTLLEWNVNMFALIVDRHAVILTAPESHRWLDILPKLPLDYAAPYLRALCSLARQEPRVEAYLILKLRKLLYRKEERFRVIAMNGFCTLLDRAIHILRHDVSTLSQLYSQHTTKALTSFSQTLASTQYVNTLPQTSSIAEELFRQFCSLFKRALELQTIVRKALYDNFVALFAGCVILREPILKLLTEHFEASYYNSDETSLPPIQLEACVSEAAGNVYDEPVTHLLWAISSCTEMLSESFTSDNLIGSQFEDMELSDLHRGTQVILSSVIDRMKRCELQHFDLNDTISFAHSKSNRCIVQNLRSVLEFCMSALLEKVVDHSETMVSIDESVEVTLLHWMSLHRWSESKLNSPPRSKASKKNKSDDLKGVENASPTVEEERLPKSWITLRALRGFFRNVHIAWSKDERWIASTEHSQLMIFFIKKLEDVLMDEMDTLPGCKGASGRRRELELQQTRKASILQISKDILWISFAICQQSKDLFRSRNVCLKRESVGELAFQAFRRILAYWKKTESSICTVELHVHEAFKFSEMLESVPDNTANSIAIMSTCIRSMMKVFAASFRQNVEMNSNGLELIQELERLAGKTPTAASQVALEELDLHVSEWLKSLLSSTKPLLSPGSVKQVVEMLFRRELLSADDKLPASCPLVTLKFAKCLSMGLLLACKVDDITDVIKVIGADGDTNQCPIMPFQLEHQSSSNILAIVAAVQNFVQEELDALERHLKDLQQQMRHQWSLSWKILDSECMEKINEILASPQLNDMAPILDSSPSWSYLPHRMFHIVTILVPFVLVDFNKFAISSKTLRLCRRVLKLLTKFIQIRIRSKVSELPPIIQQLFCVTGAQFSPALLEYIACIYDETKESNSGNDVKKAKKRSGEVLKPRSAVPMQSRVIPEVIFALEQFDTALIRLSRLCKGVDFSIWCRLRQSRDFRLNRDRIRAFFGHDEPEPESSIIQKRRRSNEVGSSLNGGRDALSDVTIASDAESAREEEEELEKTQRQIESNEESS